jgi:RNA polymerase sigma-70 factor (ECF subfamily)
MVRLYEERYRYDPGRPLAPWVYGIARNVWRDHARHRARDRTDPLGDSVDAMVGAAPNPLERAQHAEESDLIRCALMRLPEDQRLTLILRHWQGLSYEEIGEALGVPLGTVKWRIHDAHRKLAEWLGVKNREVTG